MIKMLTPSKNFNKKKREISCCDSFFAQQRKQQKIVDINLKIYPSKLQPQLFKSAPKQQKQIYFTPFYPQTPKISQINTRANSMNKKQDCSITTTSNPPTILKFQRQQKDIIKLNPLQRLKLRYSSSTSSQIQTQEQSTFKNQKISFKYQTPTPKYIQQSTNAQPNKETFEVQQIQRHLQKQIEQFQWQYKLLLLEFQRLKQQKSSNKKYFENLLVLIRKKQIQILQLQSLRKQQIKLLKQQILTFMLQIQ